MSVLIVYGTKYGFTEKCAKVLAEKLSDNVQMVNINNDATHDLASYDKIVIGGSIYAGMLRKKVKQFCSENLQTLLDKKVGLYVSCSMTGDDARKQLEGVFPEELYNKAKAKDYFGGEINIEKAKFFDRLIIKMISKADKSDTKRNDGIVMENIGRFAEQMNNC